MSTYALDMLRNMVRRYVLDKGLVEDLRTGVLSTPEKVLNGDLDAFVRAQLLSRIGTEASRLDCSALVDDKHA